MWLKIRAGSAVSWDDGRSGLGAALQAEPDPLPASPLCAVPDGHCMPVPGGRPAGGPSLLRRAGFLFLGLGILLSYVKFLKSTVRKGGKKP